MVSLQRKPQDKVKTKIYAYKNRIRYAAITLYEKMLQRKHITKSSTRYSFEKLFNLWNQETEEMVASSYSLKNLFGMIFETGFLISPQQKTTMLEIQSLELPVSWMKFVKNMQLEEENITQEADLITVAE